jgi:malonate-semialdehyde dehydrogenase (acetylating)/methylmalonate-semialdehyde dehydrogenase
MAAGLAMIGNFIAGQQVAPSSGRRAPIFNPATGEVIAEVGFSGTGDIEAAVGAALASQPAWGETTPVRRARVMLKFLNLLNARTGELAAVISREHGKTNADASGEIARGIEIVEFACGIAEHLKGEYSHHTGTGIDT